MSIVYLFIVSRVRCRKVEFRDNLKTSAICLAPCEVSWPLQGLQGSLPHVRTCHTLPYQQWNQNTQRLSLGQREYGLYTSFHVDSNAFSRQVVTNSMKTKQLHTNTWTTIVSTTRSHNGFYIILIVGMFLISSILIVGMRCSTGVSNCISRDAHCVKLLTFTLLAM